MQVPSERAQNGLLVALAGLAVAASAFAFWSVNRPPSSADVSDGTTTAAASIPQPTTDTRRPDSAGVTTTAPATSEPTTDTSDPTETDASPTPTAAPPVLPTVAGWLEALGDDDAHLLVLGDGYSNMPSQWVQLWGRLEGRERPVQIHHWGEAADRTFNDPIELSDVDGPELTIWSASRAGATVDSAVQRYDRFVGEADDVDAVLVTLGLSSTFEDVPGSLDALVGAIDDDLPVLVTVGPAGLFNRGVSDAIADWADENDDRVSLVDLRGEAPDLANAEQWATAFGRALDEAGTITP
ncbi:hypothetical protein [Ornithinimicrobium cerasi]|uniref:hypothetical protein n=1 Tax=Ornithinimicrobium cerasi TaxID=2248773 RepID=UPI000EFDCF92|nr:hypothetical protein [Ornithinimicrobium cerasi]